MLRRLTAATLVVLVQVGAISAPLLHVHAGNDAGHHHQAQPLHAHLDGDHHLPDHATIDHGEDSGRPFAPQVFVAVAGDVIGAPAIAVSTFALTAPPEMLVGRARHIAHGHDPPSFPSRSPRAPPAFLS